jgi:hypothetical protein
VGAVLTAKSLTDRVKISDFYIRMLVSLISYQYHRSFTNILKEFNFTY